MDQERIGKFIAKSRKEKNLTQEELAERLGITKNAVSKWERGLSFPDVSLYKKLCNELDISIEELINGEEDNSDAAKEKAIIKTLNEKNKIKKRKNKIIIVLTVIFILAITFILLYQRYLKVNLISDSDYLYDLVIDYLKEEEFKSNPDRAKEDFNTFYSYYGFGIEEENDYRYVYMWIYNESFYIEGIDALAISQVASIPCKATFKSDKLVKIEYPKDGNKYTSSIKEMFPSIIAHQVLNFDKVDNINKLSNDVLNKKNIYYDYLNIDMNKLTIDDISYNDLIFTINIGSKGCVPVQLNVFKNNVYRLATSYKACRPSTFCTDMLVYTKFIDGKYDYDIMQIIKHSVNANNIQYNSDNMPKYEIFSGAGYRFMSDDDNKYLQEFLKLINVNLEKCAEKDCIG